jgi:hypothetical protein
MYAARAALFLSASSDRSQAAVTCRKMTRACSGATLLRERCARQQPVGNAHCYDAPAVRRGCAPSRRCALQRAELARLGRGMAAVAVRSNPAQSTPVTASLAHAMTGVQECVYNAARHASPACAHPESRAWRTPHMALTDTLPAPVRRPVEQLVETGAPVVTMVVEAAQLAGETALTLAYATVGALDLAQEQILKAARLSR